MLRLDLHRPVTTTRMLSVSPSLAARQPLVTPLARLQPPLAPLPIGNGASAGEQPKKVDVDGDGELDTVVEDPTLPRGTVYGKDEDGDGDDDVVVVGTGGAVKEKVVDGRRVPVEVRPPRVVGSGDLDGDGENEVIVEDPSGGGNAITRLGDGDADIDVVTIGCGPDGRVARVVDLDGDGDAEIVVEGAGEFRADLDGDGDDDVIGVPKGAPEAQDPPNHDGGCIRSAVLLPANELRLGLRVATGIGGARPATAGGLLILAGGRLL